MTQKCALFGQMPILCCLISTRVIELAEIVPFLCSFQKFEFHQISLSSILWPKIWGDYCPPTPWFKRPWFGTAMLTFKEIGKWRGCYVSWRWDIWPGPQYSHLVNYVVALTFNFWPMPKKIWFWTKKRIGHRTWWRLTAEQIIPTLHCIDGWSSCHMSKSHETLHPRHLPISRKISIAIPYQGRRNRWVDGQ